MIQNKGLIMNKISQVDSFSSDISFKKFKQVQETVKNLHDLISPVTFSEYETLVNLTDMCELDIQSINISNLNNESLEWLLLYSPNPYLQEEKWYRDYEKGQEFKRDYQEEQATLRYLI